MYGVALGSSEGAPEWASNAAWTLAGGLAFATSLAAAARVKHSGAAVCWRLWASAAGCWFVGALLRDALALTGAPSLVFAADVCWLLFAALCVVGLAWRSPGSFSFPLFMLDTLPVVLLATVLMRIEVNASGGVGQELMVFYLYPAVFSLLALIALQLIAMQRFRASSQWWLITAGFWLCAAAAFVWPSQAPGKRACARPLVGSALGRWSAPGRADGAAAGADTGDAHELPPARTRAWAALARSRWRHARSRRAAAVRLRALSPGRLRLQLRRAGLTDSPLLPRAPDDCSPAREAPTLAACAPAERAAFPLRVRVERGRDRRRQTVEGRLLETTARSPTCSATSKARSCGACL